MKYFNLLVFIFLLGCSNQSETIKMKSIGFDSQKWIHGNKEIRGTMIDSLMLFKDSLLIDKSIIQIEQLLGNPDQQNGTDLNYFFEKNANNNIELIYYLTIRFDTLSKRSEEAWWTD